MAVRFAEAAQGTHNQKPPPSHCSPAHFCPELPGFLAAQSLLAYPRFPGIARLGGACASVRAPSAVLGRPHDERRSPQILSASGLLPLRRTPNEPMLRKENVLYCTNRGTFFISLTRRVRLSTVLWSWAIIKETGLMGLRIALLLWVALTGSTAEGGERVLPEVGPTVSAVVPLGGQRGASTEIRIRGKNLDGISEIRFARRGINAELLESSFYQAKARVTVGAQVPTGLHDLRLTTARGGHVGVFHVGSLPQQDENEPNGEIAEAQSVSTPVLIDGVADKGDYDVFRFWAEAGETVVADVMARRAGGSLDATLALLDHRGNELDFVDDYYIFKDPHLSFTAKRAGEYLIRVAGSQEQGSPDSSYRLVLGSVPVMQRVLPLGGRRGETTEFEIHGINVDRITRIVLDDSVAIGDVLEASPGRLRFRMSVPPDVALGRHQLRAEAESFEAPLPLPILLSDVEERISSAPRNRAAPQEVQLPVAITGVLDSRRAAEFFSFEVEAGERVEFDVHSMRLDYPLDPALFLYNTEGQQLAYQDEPAPNSGKEQPNLDPYLVYDFEESGRYVVMIRDSSQRGHPNNAYRMLVRRVAPDFQLRALTPTHTLFRGETNLLPLRVRRLGGWVRPVEIWLDNPPPPPAFKPPRWLLSRRTPRIRAPAARTCGSTARTSIYAWKSRPTHPWAAIRFAYGLAARPPEGSSSTRRTSFIAGARLGRSKARRLGKSCWSR